MEDDEGRDELVFGQVCDTLGCIAAAENISTLKIPTLHHKVIVENWEVLSKEGHKLPMVHLIITCKVYSTEQSETEVEEWAYAVSLGNAPGAFLVIRPNFGDTGVLAMDVTSHESRLFQELWPQSVWNNSFWKLLGHIDADYSRPKFIKMAVAFAKSMKVDSMPEVCAHPPIQALVYSVAQAFRGLHGLVNPRPGVAFLEDVMFVMPVNASSNDLIKNVPKLGRALISLLRKDRAAFWTCSLNEFRQTIGLAEQCKQLHDEMEPEAIILGRMKAWTAESPVPVQKLLGAFAENAPDWKVGLRKDGLVDLDHAMHKSVGHLFSLMPPSGNPAMLQLMQKVCVIVGARAEPLKTCMMLCWHRALKSSYGNSRAS